jgi:hypothetical protein
MSEIKKYTLPFVLIFFKILPSLYIVVQTINPIEVIERLEITFVVAN